VGQATGVENPVPMEVSTGSSLFGVHVVVAARADENTAELPAVSEATRSTSTVCVLLSLKLSLIEPR